jgi:ATP-dependent DNA ligase
MKATFIKPQLAKDGSDEGVAMGDSRFIAEPKIDGHRGQIHIRNRKPVAVFSRRGNNKVSSYGLRWIQEIDWKVDEAVLDVELYSGSGVNGDAAAVATELARGHVKVALFDLLSLEGIPLVRTRSWQYRRDMLEHVFRDFNRVPYTANHQLLWDEWVVKSKGEGIILKRKNSLYIPGKRSSSWLKMKHEETVDVVITGVIDEPSNGIEYRTGEVALTFGFWDPSANRAKTTGQGVMVGSRKELTTYVGRVAELLCNDVAPDAALRHHRFVQWRDDKTPDECVRN